ncbi:MULTISPECIES: FAD-binding and (Fe-S)-binding domain-containing protein [unclassified Pseudonocardia]|uniref:FAD-binding and (Fe-S)-binding domain-containing protein n=1 Tax=unclassified Pseudonocardia TaxID=2619320 RepID=UPI000963C5D5|nr:FAD-binding and (Fe-S)-binding domain-containing protein [Pseudonocardia sp. Ae707_Ps1]OLM21531.1 putative D-lactate dehydrogenase, Fe-S protein, FAD/FMN-containing [Pseudonocardia sp. Ae707_Ps1]
MASRNSSEPQPATDDPRARLLAGLHGCVADPGQVRDGELARHVGAHDASHFHLLPTAVVAPRGGAEVGRLLALAHRHGVPLTFRSGGTSLSGQGVTDQLLVDTRRHFRDVEILDDGLRVRVQPGVTVRQLNARLARHGRRFGPDPASEAACTVGGVLANNASGMACGTVENSYRTLESVVAVLPSGTVVDTSGPDADERLRALEPDLHKGLLVLRDRVLANPSSVATIGRQFAMKNTMGYGLNALVDHAGPAEILTHLLVGSEGTLAFVASATFRTVPLRTRISSALLVFDDLFAANAALPELVATGAATLELMDATSLRVGQSFADCPPEVARIAVREQAALLVEYQELADDELAERVAAAGRTLAGLPTAEPVELSTDPAVRGPLWKLRKGLYSSVAGARPQGSTALLEDVVVPVPALAGTCRDLAVLFDRYAYRDSVVFGHAKDGNIHFMLTDRFETDEQLGRYRDFTEEMVDLVLGHGGSLKAEHGTGRVMAPYVRRQYGDELYDVMREIKRLFDPHGVLNPGVVLSDDPDMHLKHIKLSPVVDAEVDRCTSCGFCEPVCPSRDLTLTPRQRIAARRAIREAELAGDTALAGRLESEQDYESVQTCAVDGMCQTACPVLINTGDLVKKLRRDDRSRVDSTAWTTAAKHWSTATRGGSAALTTLAKAPAPVRAGVTAANRAARAVAGTDRVPLWSGELPGGGPRRRRPAPAAAPAAVYLPACVNTLFGPAGDGPGVQASVEALCAAAGITLLVPPGIDALCCGTPWSSKGLPDGYAAMRERVVPAVLAATRGGELPVVGDASSCTEGFHTMLADAGVRVVDAMRFVVDEVLPRLGEHPRVASVSVHPTCSSARLQLDTALLTLAAEVADDVHVPDSWGCCAFAGDRGMLHPELTASATAGEAAEVRERDAAAHVSCNRTCELGMTRATGRPYEHVLEVLARQVGVGTQPAGPSGGSAPRSR